MKVTRTSAAGRCPACLRTLDAATGPDDAAPSPGDLSLCIYCGVVLMFQTDLTLRQAPAAVLDSLDDESRANLDGARLAVAIAQAWRQS